MKRRGRALRRRYGRARGYRIGARGLEKTDQTEVIPGRVYAMGASSSPTLIVVDSAGSDRIGYHQYGAHGDTSPKVIERWIGEDLIARGNATFTQRYGVDPSTWVTMTEDQRAAQFRSRL